MSVKPLEKSSSVIQVKWISWRGRAVLSGNKDVSRVSAHLFQVEPSCPRFKRRAGPRTGQWDITDDTGMNTRG